MNQPDIQASVLAAFERSIQRQKDERRARRLLRKRGLVLREQGGAYLVVDPYMEAVPADAPMGSLDVILGWIAADKPRVRTLAGEWVR